MRKKLEIAANVAIILVAGLLGYVLLDRYVFHKPPRERPTIAAGEKIPLADVDWQRNGRTLVLVVQKRPDPGLPGSEQRSSYTEDFLSTHQVLISRRPMRGRRFGAISTF